MIMEPLQGKIVQVSTKSLLFKRCQCGGSVTAVVMNPFTYGKEIFYCDSKCNKITTDFKLSYKLTLVVLDIHQNKLESIIAYDNVAADLIGCSPIQYEEHLKQDSLLSKKLEDQLVGMYCSFKLDKRGKNGSRKAKKLDWMYENPINVMDLIQKEPVDISFDDSLLP